MNSINQSRRISSGRKIREIILAVEYYRKYLMKRERELGLLAKYPGYILSRDRLVFP